MTELSFALVGFGNVGKAFVRLLQQKKDTLRHDFGFSFKITAIATGRHGMAIDPEGLDLDDILTVENLGSLSRQPVPETVLEFIEQCPADVLFENSPVNHETGQPALDHLRAALRRGMHAITANKGPLVHGYHELMEIAERHNVRFMFESTVMDGAPIFSMFREPLPALELKGFEGILNSCTNLLFERMEAGESLDEAVAFAQSIGITETDPSEDIDGWDAAVKASALVTVLMGYPLKPQQVDRTGIRGVTPAMVAEAQAAGERWKLVCRVWREGELVRAVVAPQRVSPRSPLFSINGTSSFVLFKSDVLPGLGIIESDPGVDTTAYGLLADLLNVIRTI